MPYYNILYYTITYYIIICSLSSACSSFVIFSAMAPSRALDTSGFLEANIVSLLCSEERSGGASLLFACVR